jgi:hypothetical protein
MLEPEPNPIRIRSASASVEPKKQSVSFTEPLSISTPTPPGIYSLFTFILNFLALPAKDELIPPPTLEIPEDIPVAKTPPKLSIPPSPKTQAPPALPAKNTPVKTVTITEVTDKRDSKTLTPSKSGGTIGIIN